MYLAHDVLLEEVHHLLRLHRRPHVLGRELKIDERDLRSKRERRITQRGHHGTMI